MVPRKHDLDLTPLKGKSGKAFLGTYPDGQRVFIKFDPPPILLTLAKEQIAPQLLWVERLNDGRNMAAQEWLQGRILNERDMTSKQIVHILHRLHKSKHLTNQLLQQNQRIESPYDLLTHWQMHVPEAIKNNTYLKGISEELRRSLPDFNRDEATIVHGDVRHSNWVITTSGLIYLVDWDSVKLTDKMYDIAYLLSHYIPSLHWEGWLAYYGYENPQTLLPKIKWYGQLIYLSQIVHYYKANDLQNVNKEIYALRKFREQF